VVKKEAQHSGLASLVLPRRFHRIPSTAEQFSNHLLDGTIHPTIRAMLDAIEHEKPTDKLKDNRCRRCCATSRKPARAVTRRQDRKRQALR
jgi:hypothetical protein